MKACLGKVEATIMARQEQMRAKLKTDLKEMRVTELKATAEHYDGAPYVKAMHMLTALHTRASNVLHGVPKEAMYYEETIEALDCFADQNLPAVYCSQFKTRTHNIGKSLQEFSTTIKQLTHCVSTATHKNHVHRGPGKALSNGIRNRGIKQQILPEGKKTFNEALR
jgi:hypothetical protein